MRDDLNAPNLGIAPAEYNQRTMQGVFKSLELVLARLLAKGPVRVSEMTVGDITWTAGTGTPEGVVTAPVGSLYSRTNGGASTCLYVKESGTGSTGWVAK